jgi:hypothetical protein
MNPGCITAKLSTMPAAKSNLPWWREPIAIGLFSITILASAAVMSQGWFRPATPIDPTKPAPLPGGGSFCDPAAPVQSTAVNPSTQFSK